MWRDGDRAAVAVLLGVERAEAWVCCERAVTSVLLVVCREWRMPAGLAMSKEGRAVPKTWVAVRGGVVLTSFTAAEIPGHCSEKVHSEKVHNE